MCFQKFRIHLTTSPDTFLDLNDLMTLFFWEFFILTLQHCFGCSFLHVTCNLAYIRQWESLDQFIYFMHIHNIYTIDRFHKHTHTHIYIYIYLHIHIYTIKLFPSIIKCSVSCTIEPFNWIMVKIQPSFKYSEFHVNYFTIFSLITTLSAYVTKSLQCKGILLSDVTWSHVGR